MLVQQSIKQVSIVYTCVTLFCNALVQVIYSVVSGLYSYTIHMYHLFGNALVHVIYCGFRSIFVYNTHVSPIWQCIGPCDLLWFQVNIRIQYISSSHYILATRSASCKGVRSPCNLLDNSLNWSVTLCLHQYFKSCLY